MKTGEMAMNAYDWLTTPTSDSPPSQSQIEPVEVPQMERRPMPGGQPPSGGDSSAALGILSTIPGLSAGRSPAMSMASGDRMPSSPAMAGQGQPPSAPPASAAPAGVSALPGGTGAPQSGGALNPAEAPLEAFQQGLSGLPEPEVLDTGPERDALEQRRKGILAEADERAKSFIARAEAQGEEINAEAKDEAFNQALISLGVGIGRGDLIGGLQQAGAQAAETRGDAKDEARELRKEAEQASRAERREARKTGERMFEQQMNLAIGDKKSRIEQIRSLRQFSADNLKSALQAGVRGAASEQEAEIMLRRVAANIQEAKYSYLREREKQDALLQREAWRTAEGLVEKAIEGGGMSLDNLDPNSLRMLTSSLAADLMAGSLGEPENISGGSGGSGGWSVKKKGG